jgi:hypothetical protein
MGGPGLAFGTWTTLRLGLGCIGIDHPSKFSTFRFLSQRALTITNASTVATGTGHQKALLS